MLSFKHSITNFNSKEFLIKRLNPAGFPNETVSVHGRVKNSS
ncbi:MAG: hypothetical protein UZ04_CHB001000235 [Chlorobi bacterium OLB4]|jgi:hypothetical protein|nr:MAG: hypothetical protein UZ04_CHB001000235 [Chlorobi bacterium OLB4]MBV6399254.1 hypothetical protein [Ignavibacteria bacterium]